MSEFLDSYLAAEKRKQEELNAVKLRTFEQWFESDSSLSGEIPGRVGALKEAYDQGENAKIIMRYPTGEEWFQEYQKGKSEKISPEEKSKLIKAYRGGLIGKVEFKDKQSEIQRRHLDECTKQHEKDKKERELKWQTRNEEFETHYLLRKKQITELKQFASMFEKNDDTDDDAGENDDIDKDKDVKEEKVAEPTDYEKFFYACRIGNMDEVRKYVESGIDVNGTCRWPLCSIEEPLKVGEFTDATALDVAGCSSREEVVKFLIDHGAKPINKNEKRDSTLYYTCTFGSNANIVKMLVNAGSILNDSMALQYAYENEQYDSIITLLELGIDTSIYPHEDFKFFNLLKRLVAAEKKCAS